ncbi:MAG: Fe-Mn family superoxide dismutase [Elusimicrobiota bacterium]
MEKKVVFYSVNDYAGLLGIAGFSETLLVNHFKLYQGYVKNINLVLEKLNALTSEGKDRGPEYGELKRRFGWEFNGMRLHEYYFENLGGQEPINQGSSLYKKIAESFGSFDVWKQDFVSTGSMRGIGWAILCQDLPGGQLFNVWVNEHASGHLAGAKPILALDAFEHSYFTDYQLERGKYIEAFFNNINWEKAASRLVA